MPDSGISRENSGKRRKLIFILVCILGRICETVVSASVGCENGVVREEGIALEHEKYGCL